MHDPIDWYRQTEDHLAALLAYMPCPACGESVGTTADGPCVACLDAFADEDAA